jgi:hypothetical protein
MIKSVGDNKICFMDVMFDAAISFEDCEVEMPW